MENAKATSAANSKPAKLSFKEKLGYGLGDLGNGFMFDMGQLFLLKFYTDVLGISPAFGGLVFLVSKISDAFVDSSVGAYLDGRTKFGKNGKFRPFIKNGTIPLALMTVITFCAPNVSVDLKIFYAFATYIIWNAMYSVVNIPYGSLAAAMSQDPVERTQLSSFRNAGSVLGMAICGMVVVPLMMMFPTPKIGYPAAIGMMSVLGVICHLLCYKFCKENIIVKPKEGEKIDLGKAYKSLLHNRPLIAILLVFVFSISVQFLKSGVQIYFLQYNLGNPKLLSQLSMVVLVFQLAAIFIAPFLVKKFGKKYVYAIGLSICVVADLCNFFIPTSYASFVALWCVAQFGLAIGSAVSWAMISDCIEYGEWQSGQRTEGVVYSTASFSRKIAQALAGFIPGVVLTIIGYVPNAQQSAATLVGIRQLMFLYPAILLSVAILCLIFVHNLSDHRYKEILAELGSRKATV